MFEIIADNYLGSKEHPIPIGKKGENHARVLIFKCLKELRLKYGVTGTWAIYFQRPLEATSYAVTESWESTEGYACWDINSADTAKWGEGYVEFRFYPNSSDVYKSQLWTVKIENTIAEDGPVPPSPYSSIVDTVGRYAGSAMAAEAATRRMQEEVEATIGGEAAERQAADEDLQNQITEMRAAIGAPKQASTASAMTDHDEIYVYTGSETGYVNGNWYYWNGSAWASGGVYNAVAVNTDKTLTVENEAADAKAAGDRLSALETAIETKAEIDGAYESMMVGSAEQLLSSMYETDNVPYIFRTAGGSINIGDREFDKLVGGTIAWNQLVENGNFAGTTLSNWISNYANISVSNNVCSMTATAIHGGIQSSVFGIVSGHKYLINADMKGAVNASNTFSRMRFYASGTLLNAINLERTGNWKTYNAIYSASNSYASVVIQFQDDNESSYGAEWSVRNVMLIDLTQMFGSTIADYIYGLETATAGAGVAYFRKLFPMNYYAYNAGELLSVKASNHITTGLNQWDEEWEVGSYDRTSGVKVSGNTTIRSKNYIPCIPNTSYYFKSSSASGGPDVFYYDADKNYLSYNAISRNNTFTTPNNAHYMTFKEGSSYGTTYNNDICINLHWDGERDGDYEPYEEHVYPLGNVELRGIPKLDSSNNLYYDGDTYEADGSVTRRYGIVDLGTLTTWRTQTLQNGVIGFIADIPDIKPVSTPNVLGNIICSLYDTLTGTKVFTQVANGISMWSTLAIISVYDSSKTSLTAEQFKTAMSGVYLVYELAEPTTETSDTFAVSQIVNDFGTEEYTDRDYAYGNRDVKIPVGHETKYQPNLRAKVENLPDPADSDGRYVIEQENGDMHLIPDNSPARLSAIERTLDSIGARKYGVSGISQSASALTRIWDSVGMVAQVGTDGDNSSIRNDFDEVGCFARRKCVGNWVLDESEERAKFIVNAYKGDPNYAEDGSMGDYVAVECPRAYYYFKDGVLGVSSFKHPGWEVFDIFKRNHSDRPEDQLDVYYMPAYALTKKNGHAVSLPGYDNEQGSYSELVTAAKTYNNSDISKYAILQPAAVNFYEWALFTVEFAQQNCQSVMQGCASLNSADSATCRFIEFTSNGGKLVVDAYNAARVAGQYIAVTTASGHTDVRYQATHKVLSVQRCNAEGVVSPSGACNLLELEDLGKGYVEYALNTNYYIAARPYRAGSAGSVSTSSGSPVSNSDAYHPFKYRERENVYANQFKTSMDLFNKRVGTGDSDYKLEWYLMKDMSNYSSNPSESDLASSRFEKLGIETAHANYNNGYVKSKKYDSKYHDIWIPYETTGASATTYFADYAYLVSSYVVRSARFGGYWANGASDGFSYLVGDDAPSHSPALYGGDLFFMQ